MTAPTPAKQKTAHAKLDSVFADAANTWVIHYSCESFYDRPNGASPRITSIAVRRLDSGQTLSFSIHQVAEERSIPFEQRLKPTTTILSGRCSTRSISTLAATGA